MHREGMSEMKNIKRAVAGIFPQVFYLKKQHPNDRKSLQSSDLNQRIQRI